jgi:hypothetical protein
MLETHFSREHISQRSGHQGSNKGTELKNGSEKGEGLRSTEVGVGLAVVEVFEQLGKDVSYGLSRR